MNYGHCRMREIFPILLCLYCGYTLIKPMQQQLELEIETPYETNADLPESVKNVLPEHAQEIYLEAFNSVWDQYDEPEERRGDSSREETAHRVAWAAVKRKYQKDDESGTWKEK